MYTKRRYWYMKFKIVFVSVFLLSSCTYSTTNEMSCIERDVSFSILKDQNKLINTCDFREKSLDFVNSFDVKRISTLYSLASTDKNIWLYVIQNSDLNPYSASEKVQLYYILRDVYQYGDILIEQLIWNMSEEYKNIVLPIWHIVLWEDLLTTDYRDVQNWDTEWWVIEWGLEYLRYEHLKFLEILFSENPERIKNISSIMSLDWAYETLEDERSRELLKKILQDLLSYIENDTDSQTNKLIKRQLERVLKQ